MDVSRNGELIFILAGCLSGRILFDRVRGRMAEASPGEAERMPEHQRRCIPRRAADGFCRLAEALL